MIPTGRNIPDDWFKFSTKTCFDTEESGVWTLFALAAFEAKKTTAER